MNKIRVRLKNVDDIELSIVEDKSKGLNDSELWEEFKRGNEEAFITIYNRYFQELCDFGVQYASLDIVEDAVQDVFINLRKKRQKLPIIKKSIRLFLFQCLRNNLFNHLKNSKKFSKIKNPADRFEITLSHQSVIILREEQNLNLKKLDNALAGLSEKQREAIYYYFYKGMSYDELKELVGYKDVKSARNLIYRIIKSLKKNFYSFF
ncbi:RNA polymerase sigma factor [Arenibacter certesii]|uniref:DNA-directed RNA polymerase sigma-70 factor n=1 Tax=Arenibacter certesii TaxID=228955 RepID=A0A918J5M9_9FLAO|nr:RNA polymerase sigma factor [Arenibacter certesii]GGW48554.1 DNA-directed RNA polymerase sigma-70 factor [Arenibacter certesii]